MTQRALLQKLPIKISAGLGLSLIDRSVKESITMRCSTSDLARVREFFSREGELRCFYCNSQQPNRWDHLHPVSRGGHTVPGNLVPACGRCDDSKQDRDLEEWVASTSKHRPHLDQLGAILRRVSGYRAEFPYSPMAWEQQLTSEQRERYRRIREAIDALRECLVKEGILRTKSRAARKAGFAPDSEGVLP